MPLGVDSKMRAAKSNVENGGPLIDPFRSRASWYQHNATSQSECRENRHDRKEDRILDSPFPCMQVVTKARTMQSHVLMASWHPDGGPENSLSLS
jgi:hypothetical protein